MSDGGLPSPSVELRRRIRHCDQITTLAAVQPPLDHEKALTFVGQPRASAAGCSASVSSTLELTPAGLLCRIARAAGYWTDDVAGERGDGAECQRTGERRRLECRLRPVSPRRRVPGPPSR